MEESKISQIDNDKHNNSQINQKNLPKETVDLKFNKYLKKFIKSFVVILISIIALYSVIYFIKMNSLKPLETSKKWHDSIPYFEISLITRYNYNSIWDKDGELLYQVYLKGDTSAFKYDNYDSSNKLFISFLDSEGFKVAQYDLMMYDFTRIIDEKGKVIGFSRKDHWYVTVKDLESFKNIDVSYTVEFKKR